MDKKINISHTFMKNLIRTWCQCIFPIKKSEFQKVFSLLILKFLISFVYDILTCMKDTLLVTNAHAGAEVILVIKGALIFPLSILIVFCYAKLNNLLQQNTIFYGSITFFLVIVVCYGFLLYPNRDALLPHPSADWLTTYFHGKFSHFIAIYRYWIHVIFFITAEMWGQIVLMVLYWSFVNCICSIQEAKRIYALLITAGNSANLIVGPLITSNLHQYKQMDFTSILQKLIFYVVIASFLIIGLYWWINRLVWNKNNSNQPLPLTSKTKLSLWESVKHISSSRYLLNLTIMLIACGFSINIVEITWKSYLKMAYPLLTDYQNYMGQVCFWTGLVATIASLFFSGGILRKFKWKICAYISPFTIGISGIIFLIISYSKIPLNLFVERMGSTALPILVFFGAFQNILSKAIKYTFFDATKEIAYIPLDQESKIKGKASVDMIGSRVGKTGSSWIQLLLIGQAGFTGAIQSYSGILCIILIIATFLWYRAIQYIGNKIKDT